MNILEQKEVFENLHKDFQDAVNEGNPIAHTVWQTMIQCGNDVEMLRGCITGLSCNLIDIYNADIFNNKKGKTE